MNSNTVAVRYIVNNVDQAISFDCDFLGFHAEMHPGIGVCSLVERNLMLYLNQPDAAFRRKKA